MTIPRLPLGQDSDYPNEYDPSVLFTIPRSESRAKLGIESLPFHGVDIWNAWELTWLNPSGLPLVATAQIQIAADSGKLIESKSLKLYLGSYAMSRYPSAATVQATIAADLSRCLDSMVAVTLNLPDNGHNGEISRLPGHCLDDLAIECDSFAVDPTLLRADTSHRADEVFHTHLLRSLCPVTAQPDIGSLGIRYVGPRIEPASLLRYVVSFREHNDFHESCIERMFVDILEHCQTEKLSIYARYQRRGGLDINPFRSNFESAPGNSRLWRQ